MLLRRAEYSVWGTNINVADVMEAFGKFLMEYKREDDDEGSEADSEPHYLRQLQDIARTEIYTLNIDCHALAAFPATQKVYRQLVRYPAEMIPIMDMVVLEKFRSTFPMQFQNMGGSRIHVRLYNLLTQDVHRMRDLDPSDIDQLVRCSAQCTLYSAHSHVASSHVAWHEHSGLLFVFWSCQRVLAVVRVVVGI